MLCREVMRSPVVFACKRDRVRDAARVMRDANVGFLPVCARDGRLVGTLTDRDIAVRVCAADLDAKKTRVDKVMSCEEIVVCGPNDDLVRAQQLMIDNQLARIIVVNPEGALMGVISLSDIAALLPPLAADAMHAVAARERQPKPHVAAAR